MTLLHLICFSGRFSKLFRLFIINLDSRTAERKRIFKINTNLIAESETLQFNINNFNETLEKDLNIGIFQYEDYIAFYINSTAYAEYANSNGLTSILRLILDNFSVSFLNRFSK